MRNLFLGAALLMSVAAPSLAQQPPVSATAQFAASLAQSLSQVIAENEKLQAQVAALTKEIADLKAKETAK